jgi:aerobic carbon-monoxide dehydrogenase medium subunit
MLYYRAPRGKYRLRRGVAFTGDGGNGEVKPAAFKYQRANAVEDAIEQLTELGDDAKLLAGGQSLVPMMNFRLVRPSALVDIMGIPDLRYIESHGEELRIGALTPHRWVEAMEDPDLLEGFSVLKRAARWVGHYPIRTLGTFGGSIAHADPSAEWCMLASLLDAEIVTAGPEGERVIPASDFFHGFFMTALQPDEVVVEVRFPQPAPHAALQEFARRAGDFGIVAAAVAVDLCDGKCRSARVVLGGVADVPLRIPEAERVLEGADAGGEAFEEAGQAAAQAIDPPSDVHGSADYRRDLSAVLIRRALAEAVGNVE